jgi:hypothetical protein
MADSMHESPSWSKESETPKLKVLGWYMDGKRVNQALRIAA